MTERDIWSELEPVYFDWLYERLGLVADYNPSHTYLLLAEQLHKKPFHWTVPNDDNRVADAVQLRNDFLGLVGVTTRYESDQCSVLELLIALAERITFEAYDNQLGYEFPDWFWLLLVNLGLTEYTDEVYCVTEGAARAVNRILDTFVERRYTSSGKGGLFPLQHAINDQRKIEIWDQLAEYLLQINAYI